MNMTNASDILISSLIVISFLAILYAILRFVWFKEQPLVAKFVLLISPGLYMFFLLGKLTILDSIPALTLGTMITLGTLLIIKYMFRKRFILGLELVNKAIITYVNHIETRQRHEDETTDNIETVFISILKSVDKLRDVLITEKNKMFILKESIEKNSKNIETMTSTMNEALLSQSTSFNETSTTMKELGVTSEQTTDKARVVVDTAEKSLELSQVGMQSVVESTENMKKIRSDVENIANEIKLLRERINDISDIVVKVNNISKKSNLLALNASIEASKAGSAGKGFAVVAVEIRKLAEQAQTSVSDIEVIIGKINSSAEKTVFVTEKGVRQVDEGVAQIQETGEIVKESMKSMELNVMSAQQILAASRQQSIGIDQITESIGHLNDGMKQITESSEEIKKLSNSILDVKNYQ